MGAANVLKEVGACLQGCLLPLLLTAKQECQASDETQCAPEAQSVVGMKTHWGIGKRTPGPHKVVGRAPLAQAREEPPGCSSVWGVIPRRKSWERLSIGLKSCWPGELELVRVDRRLPTAGRIAFTAPAQGRKRHP